jgi:hypothetical protein
MSKLTIAGFMLPLLLLFASPDANSKISTARKQTDGQSGTLQKMIVENGMVTIDLDLDRLSADGSLAAKVVQLRFDVAANSFFSILVFNDLLRGPEQGSMALVPQYSTELPSALRASINQLAVEKLPSAGGFDLAVRDAKTGFTFFNIEGHEYDYDAHGQLLSIRGGRLVISKEFANDLGRPSDADAVVGKISIGALLRPIEIAQLVNGEMKSLVMPPLRGGAAGANAPDLVPGPDVIVGNVQSVQQFGSAGTQVGLAAGTDSCNNGDQPVDWFELPNTDHPVVPQNLYRMSGGANNNERFEQIGQSWMKHTFEALEDTVCGTCNTSGCTTGTHLCPGCSDPYVASLNSFQSGLGSRAWINAFTGVFPSTANNHSNPPHSHDGVSHRIRVEVSDLNTALNQGATYFAEAAYITPHEYTWCQSHPDQCNMYNNVSYRQFNVSGTTSFTFSPAAPTVRMQPAVMAWAGATVNQVQPDPGNDGIWFMGYKVTNPSPGVYHYEYALYNENLDRSIQSFSVPLGAGANISNIGFHAPPQEPGWANDGTFNNQGYSSAPWTVTQAVNSITWNSETFAQNQNANAVRFGTLYNFRFDSDQPPQSANATVGFFKTGSPMTVGIQAPAGGGTPTPTPTATATATTTATATATTTPIASATPTSTPTATAAPTLTPTATPTPTATSTPRVTPTPRSGPSARPRPTPAPRP